MKKRFNNKKNVTLAVLSLVLVAVVAIGGTLAYFTDFDEVENVFTMGRVKIELDEPSWGDEDGLKLLPGNVRVKDPTVTALEGQSYIRIRMEIVDGEDNLLTDTDRIDLILASLYYDRGYDITATPVTPNIKTDDKYATTDLTKLVADKKIDREYNSAAYEFAGIETGKPGVRYYNYIANGGIFDADAEPDADVAVLFTNVVIAKDWNNEEIYILNGDTYELQDGALEVTEVGTGYKLILKVEAVQSSDMKDAAEAFAALNDATNVTIDASGA